jgi:hypothetical protein
MTRLGRLAAFVAATACAAVLAVATTASSCYTDPAAPERSVDSAVIATGDWVDSLDPTRTYEYDFAEVRPDSVLFALYDDGIPLVRAFLPLHYLCEDARGGRLTVELEEPDGKMDPHDFSLGTGRLRCSPDVRRYVVVP